MPLGAVGFSLPEVAQFAWDPMDAVAEVAALGRELGLSIELPVVLHDSNNVVVWLAPSPVVAKADARCLPKLAGSNPTERNSGKTQAPGGIHRL